MSNSDESDFEFDSCSDQSDHLAFEPVLTTQPLKSYQVPFKVLTPTDLLARQHKSLTQLQDMLTCTSEKATMLLRWGRWDVERVVEDYVDDAQLTCHKAGVVLNGEGGAVIEYAMICCEICCDDGVIETVTMPCKVN
jgi:ariadne-1